MTTAQATPQKGNKLPEWFSDYFVTPFVAGISQEFITHGNINDLLPNPDLENNPEKPYISLRQFLEKAFSKRQMVIFYNIASGPRFLTSEMEKQFKKITGIEADEKATQNDPLAAAKIGLMQKRGIPKEPEAFFPLVEKVLKTTEKTALIVQSVHFIAPTGSGGGTLAPNERVSIERLKNWAQDEEIKTKGNVIVLFTNQLAKVSSELRQSDSKINSIFIPKPSKEERAAFVSAITEGGKEYKELRGKLEKAKQSLKKANPKSEAYLMIEEEIREYEEKLKAFPNTFSVPKTFNKESFVLASQGMSLQQIIEIFLHSEKTGKPIDLDYVKAKKKEILNNEYGDVLEVYEPERGLEDIGGLENIKGRMLEVLDAIKTGEFSRVPMGIDLYGPPGTGKTAIVEALAKEAGFNFVKTKNIRSKWVGESEEKMEKLIYALLSLAPVIVMNDEADLAEAQRDAPKGDSGVSERLMKKWMEIRSDPRIRGKIVVISCSNRPDRIDAALKRSGRSDERWFVPMPSQKARVDIFKVMFRRYKVPTVITDFSQFAEKTDGLSGADIEKIVLDSNNFARNAGKKEVDDESLTAAINDFIPNASQRDIDTMSIVAIMESSSRRMLPPHIKEIIAGIRKRCLVSNLENIIAEIKSRNIIAED